MNSTPRRVIERVRFRVAEGPGTCLTSMYSTGSHGYAQVGWTEDGKRTVTLVHLVVWVARRGPIPPGMTVDHKCKNRRCINTRHLRLLTNLENARRTNGRDWPLGQCAQGHLDADHWVPARGRSKGHCGLCKKEAQAKYQRKLRVA